MGSSHIHQQNGLSEESVAGVEDSSHPTDDDKKKPKLIVIAANCEPSVSKGERSSHCSCNCCEVTRPPPPPCSGSGLGSYQEERSVRRWHAPHWRAVHLVGPEKCDEPSSSLARRVTTREDQRNCLPTHFAESWVSAASYDGHAEALITRLQYTHKEACKSLL